MSTFHTGGRQDFCPPVLDLPLWARPFSPPYVLFPDPAGTVCLLLCGGVSPGGTDSGRWSGAPVDLTPPQCRFTVQDPVAPGVTTLSDRPEGLRPPPCSDSRPVSPVLLLQRRRKPPSVEVARCLGLSTLRRLRPSVLADPSFLLPAFSLRSPTFPSCVGRVEKVDVNKAQRLQLCFLSGLRSLWSGLTTSLWWKKRRFCWSLDWDEESELILNSFTLPLLKGRVSKERASQMFIKKITENS